MPTEANEPVLRPAPSVRVAVIQDRQDLRETLAALISASDGLTMAGEYRTMEDALPNIWRERPEVALIDVGLPGMSGIEGIRRLRSSYPEVLTLVLSGRGDDEWVFDALCAGALGYLTKDTPPARLLDAIRDVVSGGSPMSPGIARRVVKLFRHLRPPSKADYGLTPHEQRLLSMIASGHNYRTAARALKVSVHTVTFHMRQIFDKLQVHSKSEAVAKALREGLIR